MVTKVTTVGQAAPVDGVAWLDLNPNARKAAQLLLKQFPNDIRFTSGRRSAEQQASAMSKNVAANRKWIEQTYKDTVQRADLQKWVDDHPEAMTAVQIAAGLEKIMALWAEDKLRGFSRHMSGDAFDVAPVPGPKGAEIKAAIQTLPKLQWYTFKEGGIEIWHAQFEA